LYEKYGFVQMQDEMEQKIRKNRNAKVRKTGIAK